MPAVAGSVGGVLGLLLLIVMCLFVFRGAIKNCRRASLHRKWLAADLDAFVWNSTASESLYLFAKNLKAHENVKFLNHMKVIHSKDGINEKMDAVTALMEAFTTSASSSSSSSSVSFEMVRNGDKLTELNLQSGIGESIMNGYEEWVNEMKRLGFNMNKTMQEQRTAVETTGMKNLLEALVKAEREIKHLVTNDVLKKFKEMPGKEPPDETNNSRWSIMLTKFIAEEGGIRRLYCQPTFVDCCCPSICLSCFTRNADATNLAAREAPRLAVTVELPLSRNTTTINSNQNDEASQQRQDNQGLGVKLNGHAIRSSRS